MQDCQTADEVQNPPVRTTEVVCSAPVPVPTDEDIRIFCGIGAD
jgi:hypothetical protein